MVDSCMSIEEDTELRDLVVQTLENNGALAKVRAELRASVFLTLEEQESVVCTEPLLNNTVKQYLTTAEGKLLFSLVREFLVYFGLNYTVSVFDPETYHGKDYTYKGRHKLSEELGISTKEPLLGEILKKTITSTQHNQSEVDCTSKEDTTGFCLADTTFDLSTPKILLKDTTTTVTNDVSEKLDCTNNSDHVMPINVKITDKKITETFIRNEINNTISTEIYNTSSHLKDLNKNHNTMMTGKSADTAGDNQCQYCMLDSTNSHDKIGTNVTQVNQCNMTTKNKLITQTDYLCAHCTKNKLKYDGTTQFFDLIVGDGVKEKTTEREILGELPPLSSFTKSLSSDLPPFDGKKASFDDLKELLEITDSFKDYDQDLTPSATASSDELSPIKTKNSSDNKDSLHSLKSLTASEVIREVTPSSTSCLENYPIKKNMANFDIGVLE